MKRADKLSDAERERLWAVFEASVDELRRAWVRHHCSVRHVLMASIHSLSIREEILNYFDDRVTNAFAEGITNKIKVMKRRSYGFRDPFRYRQKVLLSCRHRRSQLG